MSEMDNRDLICVANGPNFMAWCTDPVCQAAFLFQSKQVCTPHIHLRRISKCLCPKQVSGVALWGRRLFAGCCQKMGPCFVTLAVPTHVPFVSEPPLSSTNHMHIPLEKRLSSAMRTAQSRNLRFQGSGMQLPGLNALVSAQAAYVNQCKP